MCLEMHSELWDIDGWRSTSYKLSVYNIWRLTSSLQKNRDTRRIWPLPDLRQVRLVDDEDGDLGALVFFSCSLWKGRTPRAYIRFLVAALRSCAFRDPEGLIPETRSIKACSGGAEPSFSLFHPTVRILTLQSISPPH